MLSEPRRIKDLGNAEHDAFYSEFEDAMITLIKTVLSSADKYRVDRDEAMLLCLKSLSNMVTSGTFKHFETEGEPDDV